MSFVTILDRPVYPEEGEQVLQAWRVMDYADAQVLRRIRNACRDGFAHDTHEITEAEQDAWWDANQTRFKCWLYRQSSDWVGFGVLRRTEDGRWWTSVGVLPDYAGRGYGGAITHDLVVRAAPDTCWAQARKDNPSACRLHHERDWEVIEDDGRLLHFRTWPRPAA